MMKMTQLFYTDTDPAEREREVGDVASKSAS